MAGPDTKGLMVAAAEELFAARGIDAVSLREITRAAGQRNERALQYHFGDRQGILAAVLAKHRPAVEAARHALLDQYEQAGDDADLRNVAAALVLPLAAKLADPDGGRAYLQILGHLINRSDPILAEEDPTSSILRWRDLVDPWLPPGVAEIHGRFTAVRYAHVELARRAVPEPRPDDRLFVSRLVDVVAAILGAPLSPQTQRLMGERKRAVARA